MYVGPIIQEVLPHYVHGATKVCIRNVLGMLRVLYPAIDLNQVTTDYDSEEHLATMERSKEELDGLATTIANDLDLRMEKPDEQACSKFVKKLV